MKASTSAGTGATQAKQTLESTFKDHYQTLQLHPEADASLIEAAYWHLARSYNAAKRLDSSAIAITDDLNEAYGVLAHRRVARSISQLRTLS